MNMNTQGSLHYNCDKIIEKIEWLFHVIPLTKMRETDQVIFNIMPLFPEFNGIDVVTHAPWASSPGSVGEQSGLWYMHNGQEDNLITLHGNRYVELYTKEHGKIERFEISHRCIKWDGKILYDGPAVLWWPTHVFHRNYSPEGSVSMNFAVRTSAFDMDTEFNIYDLNTDTWEYDLVRLWKLDQPK